MKRSMKLQENIENLFKAEFIMFEGCMQEIVKIRNDHQVIMVAAVAAMQ